MADFDVFISYKHTDDSGEITADYEIAESLYQRLSEHGVNAFFSSETIFHSGIGDYKKAIDRALEAARLLVVIATKPEFLLSGWIEYEYETFYEDILSERKRDASIVSYTKGIGPHQLPRTLARLQNYSIEQMPVDKLVEYIAHALGDGGKESRSQQQPVDDTQKRRAIETRTGRRQGSAASAYVSDYSNEIKRLELQAGMSAESDQMAITCLFDKKPWASDERLFVLDVGGAYGYVANNAFAGLDQVEKILCIDNNRRVVERAEIIFAENPKMAFAVIDVESDSFETDLEQAMLDNGIDKWHIVYSALTLHHLKNPDKALRRLRTVMDADSYIVLRGSDDGSKLCYPDSELMESIIAKTLSAHGASDRINGRKLYTQLVNSGFQDVTVLSRMIDLSHIPYDERETWFNVAFSYRSNYFKRRLEANPDDERAQEDYAWMTEALAELENQFFRRDFWYCSYDYMALARR